MTDKQKAQIAKNGGYWEKRFKEIEAAKHRSGSQTISGIEEIFSAAQKELESQIQVWYGRFAKNNQISLPEAKRLLNTRELAEFKWDVDTYIKYGRENTVSQRWTKQLKNASARVHVSRLEALKYQTQQTLEKLYGNQLDQIDTLIKRQYLDGYYHTLFEVQKGYNAGWDIAAIDERSLKAIMSKPWAQDGRNFSDRIWADKGKLINQVHTELMRNTILGKAPDSAIENISKSMAVSKSNAGRLVMTESAYFSNLAQKDAYDTLGVERYEILETLDSSTCQICGVMDGKIFAKSDFQAGVTAPPFHPWCRGTTVPYFDDDIGERAARNPETGKVYYVPSDMKYGEWKEKYVGADKGISGDRNGASDDKYTYGTSAEKNKAIGLKKTADKSIIKSGGETMEVLPKASKAVIPIEKLTKYALSPAADPDKAKAFKLALGYDQNNADKLIENIYNNLNKFGAKRKGNFGYGEKYEVVMNLTGENGKTAKVLTAWIDDAETKEMRLITLHID